jgi:membrane protease YdiL (CAAX protease family)
MGVAFALLFFSGNIYYTLHTILCCTIIVIATAISRDNGRWQIAWSKLRRVAIGGLLGLGLVMIQFLPVWTVRDYVSHKTVTFDSTTGAIEEQYDLGTGMSNLITPWESWCWQ